MKEDCTQLCFSEAACPRTTINLGMWSFVAAMGGAGRSSCDLIVSGLRECVKYYRFEDLGAGGAPRYGRGESIRGLDGWNLNVIPLNDESSGGPGLFVRSGGAFVRTEPAGPPRLRGEPVRTGVEGVLDLHRYGRYVSTAALFRRPGADRFELVVTVVDMSDYYPGERGVYGGRAIGIDQEGRNIGYDAAGKWLGGRGRAELHLFVVEPFHGCAEPRPAGRLALKGKPIDVLDRCGSVAVGDFDGDGCLEAIVLDEWRLEAYRLSAPCGDPELSYLGVVQGPDGPYVPEIQFPSPTAVRFPGRALPDLVMGSFSGEVYFAANLTERAGEIRLSALSKVTGRDRELRIGGFAVPALADLDGDGRLDLLVGDEDGYISFVRNVGSPTAPEWDAPTLVESKGKPIRILSGYGGNIQGPDEQLHGYACPCPCDWTGDGLVDLVVGSITGYYLLYRNVGSKSRPEFDDPLTFTIHGHELRGEWRVRPAVADFDGDGVPSLIALDTQGMIARYRKATAPGSGPAALEPGERLVDNLGRWMRLDNVSGAQGRAKLVACDWTGSGTIDIIVGTGRTTPLPSQGGGVIPAGRATFLLLQNIGRPGDPVFLLKPLCFPDGSLVDLGTHSCAPTVGDIDGDGELEIVAGEETGRLFLFTRHQFGPEGPGSRG